MICASDCCCDRYSEIKSYICISMYACFISVFVDVTYNGFVFIPITLASFPIIFIHAQYESFKNVNIWETKLLNRITW